MTQAHILGFPRIGAQRELKFATESFWRGELDQAQLEQVGRELRSRHWALQQQAGMDWVCVGDFAWYDQVLSTLALLGALPSRFGFAQGELSLQDYFVAARGNEQHFAMEMTKWFDTNYHYLVPEWSADLQFAAGDQRLFAEVSEAQAAGHAVKVCLLGPLSLLYLGKQKQGLANKLDLLPALLGAYQRVLTQLREANVAWVQIDEPILALDLPAEWLAQFEPVYQALQPIAPQLLLTTYFESVAAHADLLCALPVAGLHLDLKRAPQQLASFAQRYPANKVLSLGVIDGRNIWRADLSASLNQISSLALARGDKLWLGTSCSLLHVPVDLNSEQTLDAELRSWLAFATQKLDELAALKAALKNDHSINWQAAFAAATAAALSRKQSSRIHNETVQKRLQQIKAEDSQRQQVFAKRAELQQQRFNLPAFPTTTIGSFPQTKEIRKARADFKKGAISHLDYLEAMRAEIRHVIQQQEELDIDVLVHGEAERNDMVEYFGEQLWGYAFSQFGWVQSYGSRCVKPPIIYGDVYRPEAMTVSWSSYAQSLSSRPVKGMLTGPVTMLQWSFVRDDQPRQQTAWQIALALRDEVRELEAVGIGIIQIDEPAFREGLPLKQKDWKDYLDFAVQAFKLSSCGVADQTQIHTHMCYSEFNDILSWIAAMDADVITIETSRSDMELLEGFADFAYPNQIGPGVYDIHSPRVPRLEEMQNLLRNARKVIPDQQLWVNPDCGWKTRGWPETLAALKNMVLAAKLLRAEVVADGHEEAGSCCAAHASN